MPLLVFIYIQVHLQNSFIHIIDSQNILEFDI